MGATTTLSRADDTGPAPCVDARAAAANGLYGRADLAGLNLAEYPAVLIELGNMRNADDAAQMTSGQGWAAYADAVAKGIVTYLGG